MPVELKFRPFFAWFGNMNLVSHAWKFLGLGLSEVKVHYHKPRRFSDFSGRKKRLRITVTKFYLANK